MEICQLRIGKSTRPGAGAAFVCLPFQVAAQAIRISESPASRLKSPEAPGKPHETYRSPHSGLAHKVVCGMTFLSAIWDIFTFCSNLSTETVDVRLNAASSRQPA